MFKIKILKYSVYCNNAACEKGSWFHLECLGLEEDEVVHKEWFCSEECHHMRKKGRTTKKTMEDFSDFKQVYIKRLHWGGLNNMARHDAVKENDGARMIMHWKFDMFEFYEKKHPKYLIFGERLLLNVAGVTSERMIHHFVWERTVNVTGRKKEKHSKEPPL